MVTLKLSNADYRNMMSAIRIVAKSNMPYNERRHYMTTLDKLEYRQKMEERKNERLSKKHQKTDKVQLEES